MEDVLCCISWQNIEDFLVIGCSVSITEVEDEVETEDKVVQK